MKHIFIYSALILLASCTLQQEQATRLNRQAVIFPDYKETTLPCNIAAPTFTLKDSIAWDNLQAVFSSTENTKVVENNGEEGFCIDLDDWKMLTASSGEINVTIQGRKDGNWMEYDSFKITISPDSIDEYLVYRLIEPGYKVWNKMGIYERNISSYEERAFKTNDETDGGCINCHSYCNYDRNKMLYHQRVGQPETYFYDGNTTKCISPSPSFVYPSWHPEGRYVAFSSNNTKQAFHTVSRNRIEVMDFSSDLLVYDTETEETLTSPLIHSQTSFETFPAWAPDGKTLYFCSADSVLIPDDYDKVRYSLCSITFDAKTKTFGSKVDTLYNNMSVSFPAVSPDNRYLMFTRSAFGNFSIWHKDADLYLLDLNTHEVRAINELNSDDVESYHSWSSNGKWVVFSTRREDGLYTRAYFAHFEDGRFTKPFALPQMDADFTTRLMKSYNRPEFVR